MKLYRKHRRKIAIFLITWGVCIWLMYGPFMNHVQHSKSPKNHIAYLKVHKAASSAVQNIFLRYGYTRNLVFVLGKKNNIYPQVISLSETVGMNNIDPPPKGKPFDILCSHVIYNRKTFESLLPTDTFYIGIVREPFDQMIASIRYFRIHYIFDNAEADPVSAFIRNPKRFEPRLEYSLTNNRMAYEFGTPSKLFYDKNIPLFQKYLEKLDKEFHLVLVVKYLAESVVLMKRYLNWDLQDVLYVKKNAFSQLSEESQVSLNERFFVNESLREVHRQWAYLDYALYDFFVQRLEKRIAIEGPGFQEEVQHFRQIRNRAETFCSNVSKPHRSITLTIPASRWNKEFEITNTNCSRFFLGEAEFLREIRQMQDKEE